jgi:phenylalanyl-tRNA synthetase beta subunit
MVSIGLQDTLAYRQTSPDAKHAYSSQEGTARLTYVRLKNPITPERTVMRRSAMATMLDCWNTSPNSSRDWRYLRWTGLLTGGG